MPAAAFPALDDSRYPAHGPPEEQLRFLVGYAVLAPSCFNTQPWRFRVGEDRVDLLADPSRRLPLYDPRGRELHLSCGAALYNLRLAIRHFGRRDGTDLLPRAEDPHHLATVRRLGTSHSRHEAATFQALSRRHSYRFPFDGRSVAPDLLRLLALVAESEGARLATITCPSLRRTLAGLVSEGDWQLASDPAVRREFSSWLRMGAGPVGDGVPGRVLGLGPVESFLAPTLHRYFKTGDSQARRNRLLAREAPALLCLCTEGDSPRDWLAGGQALQRVLVSAALHGLQASFLNAPVQVDELRARLQTLVDAPGVPQALIRLGYPSSASPPRSTPRRRLEEVLAPAARPG